MNHFASLFAESSPLDLCKAELCTFSLTLCEVCLMPVDTLGALLSILSAQGRLQVIGVPACSQACYLHSLQYIDEVFFR